MHLSLGAGNAAPDRTGWDTYVLRCTIVNADGYASAAQAVGQRSVERLLRIADTLYLLVFMP
ncbi:hypothetical protein SAMN04488498_10348 [Mesorhizobium albiziae]|uniref:Uncharacterized protein n=1 Tax=Neomesorhizobium albiziae TaxID=335020 RepID=A0A1I3X7R0_9HYPH|nr:hypothetical protein SAMN04488498_10348 [Mesorhizobium albiziae]